MKNTKFNILMMRDDAPVRRFRISVIWIRLLVLYFLVITVLAGAASYLSYALWQEARILRDDLIKVQNRLDEKLVENERLRNLKKTLHAGSIPSSDASSAEENTIQEQAEGVTPPAESRASETGPNLTRLSAANVNMAIVKAEDMRATSTRDGMKLNFSLYNLKKEEASDGYCTIVLLTTSGESHDIIKNKTHLSFLINHYKQMETEIRLPQGLSLDEIYAVRLTVKARTEQAIFSKVYLITEILS